MKKVVLESAATNVADALRDEIFERNNPGEYLGSEDELVDRLGVSRPTLRQAARILETQQLLTVKRGWNGGFFTRKPEASAVARVAGHYLRTEGTSYGDVWHTQSIVGAEGARIAADHPDPEARRALLQLVEEAYPKSDDAESNRNFARLRFEFTRQVAQLVPSETIQLLLSILAETTRTSAAARWFMEPEHQQFTYDYLYKTARAVSAGNGTAACRHYLEFGREATKRFPELMETRVGTSAELG